MDEIKRQIRNLIERASRHPQKDYEEFLEWLANEAEEGPIEDDLENRVAD